MSRIGEVDHSNSHAGFEPKFKGTWIMDSGAVWHKTIAKLASSKLDNNEPLAYWASDACSDLPNVGRCFRLCQACSIVFACSSCSTARRCYEIWLNIVAKCICLIIPKEMSLFGTIHHNTLGFQQPSFQRWSMSVQNAHFEFTLFHEVMFGVNVVYGGSPISGLLPGRNYPVLYDTLQL